MYMHRHICAQPAVNMLQMCTLMSKEHVCNAYNYTCTGAQNTCSKVHATPTAKKSAYIYTHTHLHTHTRAQEYTCTSMTLLKHAEEWLLGLKIYAQTCIHIHIHMCAPLSPLLLQAPRCKAWIHHAHHCTKCKVSSPQVEAIQARYGPVCLR